MGRCSGAQSNARLCCRLPPSSVVSSDKAKKIPAGQNFKREPSMYEVCTLFFVSGNSHNRVSSINTSSLRTICYVQKPTRNSRSTDRVCVRLSGSALCAPSSSACRPAVRGQVESHQLEGPAGGAEAARRLLPGDSARRPLPLQARALQPSLAGGAGAEAAAAGGRGAAGVSGSDGLRATGPHRVPAGG